MLMLRVPRGFVSLVDLYQFQRVIRDVAKFDRSRSRDRCRRNRKGLSFFYIMTSVHSELSQYIENIEKYRKRFDRRSIEFRKVPIILPISRTLQNRLCLLIWV